jgi:hypothetical protein
MENSEAKPDKIIPARFDLEQDKQCPCVDVSIIAWRLGQIDDSFKRFCDISDRIANRLLSISETLKEIHDVLI